MNKNSATNEMIMLGTGILIIGMILAYYSVSTYVEIKNLGEKIDFEMIDNNIKLSTNEKYYKYADIADFLTKKLNKNKDIPIKNTACAYMEYAQHNAVQMHKLTFNPQFADTSKKNYSAGNIRTLYNIYDKYKTCKHQSEYKAKLEEIIKEIENTDTKNNENEERMTNFLGGYNTANEYNTQSQTGEYTEQLTPEQYEQLKKEQEILQPQETEQQHVLVPMEE